MAAADRPDDRACAKCGRAYAPGWEPDPCLGYIPGENVVSACCGHGNPDHARVLFGGPQPSRLVGPAATRWLEEHAHGA